LCDTDIPTKRRVPRNWYLLRDHEGDFLSRPTVGDDFERDYKQWRKQNSHVFAVAAALVGDAAIRRFLVKRGFTPASVLIPAIIARIGVEASGLYLANLIDPDRGVQNWIVASSRMYDWGSLDNSMIGAPLALFPNPIMVMDVVVDSVDMIQEDIMASHEYSLVKSAAIAMAKGYVSKLGQSVLDFSEWYIDQPQFR
jgi:hypothetical protein